MISGSVPAAAADDRILVGRVVAAHGVRGEVAVEVLSDVPDRFEPGSEVLVRTERAGNLRRSRSVERLTVEQRRPHKGRLLVLFREVEDRDQAEDLRGADLFVESESVPAAPEGLFYHFELEGCLCVDRRRGDLGTVRAVVEDGGGLLLVVGGEEGTLPVPFVESIVLDVDTAARRIDVELPDGFVEACGSA